MSVAEDTTKVPTPIAKIDAADTAVIVNAIVNDLQSTISNTLEAPLKSVSQTPKLVETATKTIVNKSEVVVEKATNVAENTTKTILKESQSVIDETSKLIDNITSVMAGKNEPAKPTLDVKAIMSEGQAIIDETTNLAVKTAENISSIVSEEEKRLTETISRLSIEMEQDVKKATGLIAKIQKFIKLITSCTHGADKSVIIPVVVKTDHVDIKVANVV